MYLTSEFLRIPVTKKLTLKVPRNTHPHKVQVVVSVSVGGAGEVVSWLAELDGHLVGGLAAVAEHEVRVAPGGLGSLHLERVVVVTLFHEDVIIHPKNVDKS